MRKPRHNFGSWEDRMRYMRNTNRILLAAIILNAIALILDIALTLPSMLG